VKRNKLTRSLKKAGIIALIVLSVLMGLPYLVPLSQAGPLMDALPFDNSQREQVNGVLFHYRVYPPPDGPFRGKLLLIHGLGGSTFSYEAAAPLIARQGYHVVSVDLPGFGFSDRNPAYPHSQANRAKDLWQLLALIDMKMEGGPALASWHLAGHSMGGGTAAAMALQNEGRTKSLILIDPALFSAQGGSAFTSFEPLSRWLQVALERFLLHENGVRRFLTSAYGREPGAEETKGYLTPLLLPGTARALASFVKTAENQDAALLKGISTPIFALWGSEDTLVPLSQSERLLAIRPDTSLSVIAGAAHCPMETHTWEFVRIVLQALAE